MQISSEHKDIIGTLNEDGSFKKWPALNVNGGRYAKPATTQIISSEFFVVLPAGFTDWDSIKALRERYAPVAPAPVMRGTKKEVE